MNNRYLLFASKAYSFAILRPMQAAIRQRKDQAAWFLYDLDASYLKKDELLFTTADEVNRFNPKAIFVPGNWVPDFFPGVKVEIFHGFGIDKKGHFDIRGFFDLYCTHGPLTTIPFQALAKKYGFFHVSETGWPKTDALFLYKPGTSYKESKRIQKPVVLYAPTFSRSLTSAPYLKEAISRLAKQGLYHWLIKFHPNMGAEMVNNYRQLKGNNIDVIDAPDITPYLHDADILLSDTSSVVTEFLLLDKPVITFRTKSPAAHVIDFTQTDELESMLAAVVKNPGRFMGEAKKFVDRMHPKRDGKSSERVLNATDEFIEHHARKLKPKPLNLWRKFQARRRLKYYHLT